MQKPGPSIIDDDLLQAQLSKREFFKNTFILLLTNIFFSHEEEMTLSFPWTKNRVVGTRLGRDNMIIAKLVCSHKCWLRELMSEVTRFTKIKFNTKKRKKPDWMKVSKVPGWPKSRIKRSMKAVKVKILVGPNIQKYILHIRYQRYIFCLVQFVILQHCQTVLKN